MRDTDNDRIREEFRVLRADTERPRGVPDFQALMARAKVDSSTRPVVEVVEGGTGRHDVGADPRHSLVRIGGWVSLAAAAAAAGLLFFNPFLTNEDAEFESLVTAFASDAATGAWQSPTSTLLEIPGLDLGTVPSIGGSIRGVEPAGSPIPVGPEGRGS
jgi:hypothetical protein